ncbi:transcriptional regulator [Actinosynnema sp. NPDC050436]|uniref:transcriptional regulator n=1 Tax=Actinosynnema sp. NPDC050436 TaxID=3155659 RepID=UPI0033E8171D
MAALFATSPGFHSWSRPWEHRIEGAEVSYTIRLRADAFARAVQLAGFRSDYGLAKAMEVNRSTVARVLSGLLQPGPAFIGGALVALTPMCSNDLFEVIPTSTPTDRSSTGRQGNADGPLCF